MSKMIKDLMHPSAYPETTKTIKIAQTHISTVFIGDKFVYKIKKPVNFGFLDFSTIEKRKYYCKKEVELNSRFSKDVYLGIYPVTYNGTKHMINGNGKIIDYAVKMRRLADKDLMKTRLKKGNITSNDIKKIGKAIANFHNNSNNSDKINKFGKLNAVKLNTDENFQQTSEFIGRCINKEQFKNLKNWTNNFYRENKNLFYQRIKTGKIKDCHGDLHMEHICLSNPIIIFDCIEFNDRFRYIDTASDLAFLLMDLEYNGGEQWSELLCNTYLEYTNEKEENSIYKLIDFYKVYRAYVRGKVTSFILKDSLIAKDKKNKAENIAKKYFTLADSYLTE
jgi:aminoglycoside phosphotransferase family enzyme